MKSELEQYLSALLPSSSEDVRWGTMPLRGTAYLTSKAAPLPYVTSARAVVLVPGHVLVIYNGEKRHVLPGGRREEGETLLDTLRREVLEETGFEVLDPVPLGIIHFRHLGPRPDGYAYPYPDFLQRVYVGIAGRTLPEHVIHDPYVTGWELVPVEATDEVPLNRIERVFLDAALHMPPFR